MDEELGRCPFCGKPAAIEHMSPYPEDHEFTDACWVHCACDCDEALPFETEEEAARFWNTRPLEDALRQRIAQLEVERDALRAQLAAAQAGSWRPVADGPIRPGETITHEGTMLVMEWDEMWGHASQSWKLPDGLRLCRFVPAVTDLEVEKWQRARDTLSDQANATVTAHEQCQAEEWRERDEADLT